jgi:hypothetical protein
MTQNPRFSIERVFFSSKVFSGDYPHFKNKKIKKNSFQKTDWVPMAEL